MASTKDGIDDESQTKPATGIRRALSLLACTTLCVILHILLAIGRQALGLGSYHLIPQLGLAAALIIGVVSIQMVSFAAYRWLVDEQRFEKDIDLHVSLCINGAMLLAAGWSFTGSFSRILGTSNHGV